MQQLGTFIAFDLETTGLSSETDSLIEIGAVRIENGVLGERFNAVVKPRTPLSLLSKHLTGISETEISEGKNPGEAIQAFFAFAGDLPWVAHNADFDVGFLEAECKRADLAWPNPVCFDSLVLTRMAWPLWPNHRLETIAARLELPQGRGHRALPDAEWSGMAWLRAEAELAKNGPTSLWDDLLPHLQHPWNTLASKEPSVPADKASERLPFFQGKASTRSDAPKAGVPDETFWRPGGALEISTAYRVPADMPWPGRWLSDVRKALAEGKFAAFESSDKRAPALALAAAAVHGLKSNKPVLVVVADAKQEEALLGPGWVDLEKALGGSVQVTSLREPDGYLSSSRFPFLVKAFPRLFPTSERLQMLPVIAWALATASGDLLSFPGVAADRSRTLGMKLTAAGFAPEETFSFAARQAAESAQVIVVRAETFLRDLELDGALIPACDGVVVLDAQRFPEVMEAGMGREFHFFKLRHVLQWISATPEEPLGLAAWSLAIHEALAFDEDVAQKIKGLPEKALLAEKTAQKWLAKLGRQAEKKVKPGENRFRYRDKLAIELACPETPVLESLEDLQSDLSAIATSCESRKPIGAQPFADEHAVLAQEFRRCQAKLGEIRTLLSRLASPHPDEIAWMEDFQNPHKARIKSRSLDSGKKFAEKCEALHRGGCFIGPSLSLGDNTQKHFTQRMGLNHWEKPVRYGVEGPVAQEKLALLMPFAPQPQGADSPKAVANLLGTLLKDMLKPVTVFVPSHAMLKTLRDGLAAALPERLIIAQGLDGQRDNLTFLFKQASNPILLGQEWPTDLVDADGKPPQITVIARIPFAPPTDPMIAARSEFIQAEGKHPLFEILVPEAAYRLKEMVQKHRLMRTKQVVWVLDPRAARERYGNFIARGLAHDVVVCANSEEVLSRTSEWLQG
jgi:ATP-dependent DNA helicase DinG